MKILVLNYEYPPLGGGAAPVSRDICEEMVRAGNEVTVITMGYRDLPDRDIINGVNIYRLKCLRTKKSSCMPWEQYTYIMAAKRFLKKNFSSQMYDVCHTHFIIPTGEVARWLNKKRGIPVVITAHGSDVEGYNSKRYIRAMHVLLRPFWRRIVNCSYRIVSPSLFLEKLMKKAYNVSEKYVIIPNGISVSKYRLSNLERKQKIILLMGRMQKYKNMQTAIRALSKLDLNEWRIKVLGDGPYRRQLEALVADLGIESKVDFLGWVDNSSKLQLDTIKEASIYITASEFENCPMSVLEAVAAGCYPLLSDIEAHRLLIPEDEFYFDSHNVDELADKLRKRMVLGALNFSYDISRFDWSKVIERYNELLVKSIKMAD